MEQKYDKLGPVVHIATKQITIWKRNEFTHSLQNLWCNSPLQSILTCVKFLSCDTQQKYLIPSGCTSNNGALRRSFTPDSYNAIG